MRDVASPMEQINRIEQALTRIAHLMTALVAVLGDGSGRKKGQDLMLPNCAALIVQANELSSALAVIYDALYAAEEQAGTLNRVPSYALPPINLPAPAQEE